MMISFIDWHIGDDRWRSSALMAALSGRARLRCRQRQRLARAGAERLGIDFQKAGAENLPFADQRFDVVLSLRRDVHAQSGPRRARDGKRQRQDGPSNLTLYRTN